jgi:uncharacterized protein YggE
MHIRLFPVPAVALAGVLAGVLAGGCASGAIPAGSGPAPTTSPRPIITTAATSANSTSTGLTVDGVGTVQGTPDVLTVAIDVHTTAPSAANALADNNNRTAALLSLLKSAGVADKDLQTSQLSLSPNYTNNGLINGYQVDNTVTAKLRDAVRIQGITFSIDDSSALVAAARKAAVTAAKAKATQLADAAGAKLGALRSITDTSDTTGPPNYYGALQAGVAAKSAAVPLQPGTQTLEVHVNLVYDLAS